MKDKATSAAQEDISDMRVTVKTGEETKNQNHGALVKQGNHIEDPLRSPCICVYMYVWPRDQIGCRFFFFFFALMMSCRAKGERFSLDKRS